jgi:UDP-galactopyranose mutase
MMNPAPPDEVVAASHALRFREHLGVHLKVEGSPFPDNWIYVHSKNVQMARVSNHRNFSPAMSTDGVSPITVEYFTFRHDPLWNSSDEALIALAARELQQSDLIKSGQQVLSGFVIRSEKAYPVMELGYEQHISVIKSWLKRFTNLLPIGRSGMFKYNNQDHAIATGLLAARTALGIARCDPWLVNIDAEYLEETTVPASGEVNAG